MLPGKADADTCVHAALPQQRSARPGRVKIRLETQQREQAENPRYQLVPEGLGSAFYLFDIRV